ncbi:MAG: glycoside hydrolase family 15 protein [Acidimicrobiales bacterium]
MSESATVSDVNDRFQPLIRTSVEAILRNQLDDGAIIASRDFSQYHYCWLRDGSFIAHALDAAGEVEAAGRYHDWVNRTVRAIAGPIDDATRRARRGEPIDVALMPPARFSLDDVHAHDDWPNFQIDGYGTWLWALGRHLANRGETKVPHDFLDSVQRVAEYVSALALSPCYDVWEERGMQIHTSTLACVYGGLTEAARLLVRNDLAERAEEVREYALTRAIHQDRFVKSSGESDVDASTLWLAVPFGLVSADDPRMVATADEIARVLSLEGGIRRYPTDVYFGSGAWPILTASLGLHRAAIGNLQGAVNLAEWIIDRFDGGRLGEQFFGELRDPAHYAEWVDLWGIPAQNLTWSHAMFVWLALTLTAEGAASGATDTVDHATRGIRGEGSPLTAENDPGRIGGSV